MLLAFASPISAATVVTFTAAGTADRLTVVNPQPIPVSGRIRLIPDAGFPSAPVLPFSLAAFETKSFANVLANFGAPSAPAILAIESSDAIKITSGALPVGYAERHVFLPVRFNAATPAVGSLTIGIINGLVRVNIYQHQGSVAPLASRTFASSGEAVMRLRYADVLPVSMSISDGYAEVIPISGQVIGTSANPPMRRRAAGQPASVPPVLSIAGSEACEFGTAIRASAPVITGANYQWTIRNGSASTLTASSVDVLPFASGTVTADLTMNVNGVPSFASVNIVVRGKPEIREFAVTDAVVGQPAFVRWTATGDTARLYGTDFPANGQVVELATGEYRYTTSSVGTKALQLVAENSCGNTSANAAYRVTPNCTKPSAAITAPSSIDPNASFIAAMPAGASSYSWDVSGGAITSGQGTAMVTITAGSSGVVAITSTASNGEGCTDTGQMNVAIVIPAPIISDFTAPSIVEWATNATVSFALQHTDSWTITTSSTSKGWNGAIDPGDANFFGDPSQGPGGAATWTGSSTCTPNTNCTPKISGSVALTFSPYLPNNDAIILTAVGPGGTTTASIPVKIPGANCKAVDIATAVPVGSSATVTVKWITSDAGTLVPSSSLGNAFSPVNRPVPEGLATYSFLYTRSVAGDDLVRFTGPGCEVQATIK